MAANKRTAQAQPTPADADILRRAIQALGDYGHVSVRAARGHLTILVEDGAPVARATPLGAGRFGLSFHTHTGRWEPMPVVADLPQLAQDLVGLLGPYLQRFDFPSRNSGVGPLALAIRSWRAGHAVSPLSRKVARRISSSTAS